MWHPVIEELGPVKPAPYHKRIVLAYVRTVAHILLPEYTDGYKDRITGKFFEDYGIKREHKSPNHGKEIFPYYWQPYTKDVTGEDKAFFEKKCNEWQANRIEGKSVFNERCE